MRKELSGEDDEDHLRTIKLFHKTIPKDAQVFKAILDAGCAAGDLITSDVVTQLDLWDRVDFRAEHIGICAHGHNMYSMGSIALQWEGRGLTKVFQTCFHIIDKPSLPWQVIIGADTCARHHLLSVGVFMGRRPVQPDIRAAEKEAIRTNKEQHEKDAAENKGIVDAHKKEREKREKEKKKESVR